MDKWENKIAVVTGASAGIGAAIAVELAKHKITVVGLARRKERIQELANDNKNLPGKIIALECDVTKSESITAAFDWIEKNLGGVDILVNNAGTYRKANALDLSVPDENFTLTVETNLTGLLLCTRRAYKSMQNRPIGYIININSIAGHMTAGALPTSFGLNIYGATKHAVTEATEVLRLELASEDKRNIRVSSISPGAVETEIHLAAEIGLNPWKEIPSLKASDIADAVTVLLKTDESVHISELTIHPTGEKW